MKDCRLFYIDKKWGPPATPHDFPVTNPANEDHVGIISLGSATDVDRAVTAARRAFETYAETSRADRIALLQRIVQVYKSKYEEMATTIALEMGVPIGLSRAAQAAAGLGHFLQMTKVLETFPFEEQKGSTLMRKEPIGVCGLITPWNWRPAEQPRDMRPAERPVVRVRSRSGEHTNAGAAAPAFVLVAQ